MVDTSFLFSNARYFKERAEKEEDRQVAALYFLKAAEEYSRIIEFAPTKDEKTLAELQYQYCKKKAESLLSPPQTHAQRIREGEIKKKPRYEIIEPEITFDDVVGMDKLKKDLEIMILGPLRDPEVYEKYVGKVDYQGVLLFGPPGCGKTYTVRAAAGEFNKRTNKKIKFIYARSSDILSSWVGESEKNIRELFETVAEEEPCVLFFDEIEGLGVKRSGKSVYADRLVTEFLQDFEIIRGKKVVVIGASNFPWRVDPALVRRISHRILVEPPDEKTRKELFQYYLKDREIADDIDYDLLAKETLYYAISDIEEVCRLAGRKALNDYFEGNTNRKITMDDLLEAIEKHNSSLHQWAHDAKDFLKKEKRVGVFPQLYEMAERINEYFETRTLKNVE